MTANDDALNRLLLEKQGFFLPYYIDVVARHPEGIAAGEVKRQVAETLRIEFGIDIFDVGQTGRNSSTGDSRADQWANNLVSNQILDDHMLVVRNTRAILYPGANDNSQVMAPPSEPLVEGQVADLNSRAPTLIETQGGRTYRRSLQLAEYVRQSNDSVCAVNSSACVPFNARDGRAYVEVHHIVPMAMQSRCDVNLDRSINMVPLCPRCHSSLHHGHVGFASDVLRDVLSWFGSVHGTSFQTANDDLDFDISANGLMDMYGSELTSQ